MLPFLGLLRVFKKIAIRFQKYPIQLKIAKSGHPDYHLLN